LKAKILKFYSSEVDDGDFEHFLPEDPTCFGFNLDLTITIDNEQEDGSELFRLFVCSPSWIENVYWKHRPDDFVVGRHYLFVPEYDWPKIKSYLHEIIEGVEEVSWEKLAQTIGRVAQWEYEGYKEYASSRPSDNDP